MIVSVFGRTEKRPILYTLMKLCQTLGDTALITNDRRLTRLTEDGEMEGKYQNISIFVCDTTPDEVWETIGHTAGDFDHIIYDGIANLDADVVFYVRGAGDEPLDEDIVDAMQDHKGWNLVNLGYGKNSIPYTKDMFMHLEEIEYFRKLKPVDAKVTDVIAKAVATYVGMPPKNIVKVVNRK